MVRINLENQLPLGVTTLSNIFIDEYMPPANGEYVKIYLFLLRLTVNHDTDGLTMACIADQLECTSKDVLRALKYWEKQGLITCTYNPGGDLTSLCFLEPVSGRRTFRGRETQKTVSSQSVSVREPSAESPAGVPDNIVPIPAPEDRNISLSIEKKNQLLTNPEVKQILYIAQQYMQRPLSGTEIDTILYFYEEMHFSVDLLDYLIEYCVSKGGKSIHYIRKVAFSWADEGITTAKEARKQTNLYNRRYSGILKAFGLTRRDPGAKEQEYMEKWIRSCPLNQEMILEACNRTMKAIREPSFEYTDTILNSWVENGVSTMEDLEAYDAKYQEKKKTQKKPAEKKAEVKGTNFNNFSARTYDYAAIERLSE